MIEIKLHLLFRFLFHPEQLKSKYNGSAQWRVAHVEGKVGTEIVPCIGIAGKQACSSEK